MALMHLSLKADPGSVAHGLRLVPRETALNRWIAFNAVGLAGLAVQLAIVAALVRLLDCHYLIATAVAVEAAVLHNFVWHQRWTWRDRPSRSKREIAVRLMRFHLLNGFVSLAGNLGLTAFCTGMLHLDPVVSNGIAIVACSLVNFTASEVIVFTKQRQCDPCLRAILKGCATVATAVLITLAMSSWAEAGPGASAVAGWRAYEMQIDARYNASSSDSSFFALDRNAQAKGWRDAVLHGQPSLIKVDTPPVEDGKIHHWIGAIFVPGISVESLVQRLEQNAGHESEHYEDVLASRLIDRNGDRLRVFMKLRRTNLITVTYNTEHAVEYRRLTATRATARSVATKIAELADAGTPQEHEKSAADDNGFLWRLNAYWRYEAVAGGVIVECESVSLSRPVPVLIRPVANPIVDRIARESLNRTLLSLRTTLTSKNGL
jgi:putative flippase GtrA